MTSFAWEIIDAITQITNKSDVFVAILHWRLIEAGFRCIGDSEETIEERLGLPENWNKKSNYELKYVHERREYVLHGTIFEEDKLLINVAEGALNRVTVEFNLADVLMGGARLLDKITEETHNRIAEEFMKILFDGKDVKAPKQQMSRSANSTPYASDRLSPASSSSPSLSPTLIQSFVARMENDPEFKKNFMASVDEQKKYVRRLVNTQKQLKRLQLIRK